MQVMSRQRGVSLIEVSVALVISVGVLGIALMRVGRWLKSFGRNAPARRCLPSR
jgi:prepilin-type N-terminal cleavage/methylation domain-containing protein